MNKEITEEDFVNLANSCVGEGLLKTGQLNYELAKDVAKQEAIAFKKFWDNFNPPIGKFPNDEELYTLYLKDKNK